MSKETQVNGSVLGKLYEVGQQVWLDNLSRTLLREGKLKRLIDLGLSGLTSNPAILQKACAASTYYQEDIDRLKNTALTPDQRFEALAIPDIQAACDLFMPLYRQSHGNAGFVSLEVTPDLAYDIQGSTNAARRLKKTIRHDNLLIKIPGTPEGAQAIEACISEGISINVTLLFNLEQLKSVQEAYINGLRTYIGNGGDPTQVRSVASFFLSRIDTLVDKRLEAIGSEEALNLRGQSALAIARLAYQQYTELFHGSAFTDLAGQGCTRQLPLWASTSVKNKAYPALKYVLDLVGPETINTVPDATLETLIQQGPQLVSEGRITNNVIKGMNEAKRAVVDLKRLGIDMKDVGAELQREGVRQFEAAFTELVDQIR